MDLHGYQSPQETAPATPPAARSRAISTAVRARQSDRDLVVAQTEEWTALGDSLLPNEADPPWLLEIAANGLPRRLPG